LKIAHSGYILRVGTGKRLLFYRFLTVNYAPCPGYGEPSLLKASHSQGKQTFSHTKHAPLEAIMKVLLINGSPHQNGCIFTSLSEVAGALRANDVETEIFWIGSHPVQGCTACFRCKGEKADGCVFRDQLYLELVKRIKACDGIIIGSPVYYAGPSGSLCAILDRLFFAAAQHLLHKPGACVVNCRRGGASATFDRLNKYFTILQMPVVASQYWNSTHGSVPDEVRKDLEGLQTMRTLGKNMAYLLKRTAKAGLPLPPSEPLQATNFIA